MPRSRVRVRAAVENHVTELSRPIGRVLVRSLVQGRRLCDGDLDKLLVIGAIAQRMSEYPGYTDLEPDRIIRNEQGQLLSLPVSVQSISDSTGIPRESVRRKVGELIQAGWVERLGTGSFLTLTDKFYAEAGELRDGLLNLVAECVVSTEHVLSRSQEGVTR